MNNDDFINKLSDELEEAYNVVHNDIVEFVKKTGFNPGPMGCMCGRGEWCEKCSTGVEPARGSGFKFPAGYYTYKGFA